MSQLIGMGNALGNRKTALQHGFGFKPFTAIGIEQTQVGTRLHQTFCFADAFVHLDSPLIV